MFCIPLITIFPATTAMFGVVRKWYLGNEKHGVFKTFLLLFKENFKKSILISVIWIAIGAFLYFDLRLIDPGQSLFHLIFFISIIFVLFVYLSMTVYLFSVLVHVETSWKLSIRNAWYVVLSSPLRTMIMMLFVLFWGLLIYMYPLLILISVSVVVYVLYAMSHQIFLNLQNE